MLRRILFIVALFAIISVIVLRSTLNDAPAIIAQSTASSTITAFVPLVQRSDPPTPTSPGGSPPAQVIEPFEDANLNNWNVNADSSNGGHVERSNAYADAGTYSAHLSTSGSNDDAQIRVNFNDPASNHIWGEHPGNWFWQRTRVYVPSTTVAQLGPSEYLTLAGSWPSNSSSFGWFLRVRQNGELYLVGYKWENGTPVEFQAYGVVPQDQWFDLEIGLHTQNGPGVKRAFAFLIDGDFYGWYHQGRIDSATFNRIAFGLLNTNSNDDLDVFVDQWYAITSDRFPDGPDSRSTANVQDHDFRNASGVQVQYDWSTWEFHPLLSSQYGVYTPNRIQSGHNHERMPDLTEGWAEIEIDWPNGTPNTSPTSYFGPMVGFRKDIALEENLEVIPIGQGGGNVNLALEAWVNGGPQIKAQWPLPLASIGGGSHIPEPGDIIRARWERVSTSQLNVRASYYDASANQWHVDVTDTTIDIANIAGINFSDGWHTASSITIDSSDYSIRRHKVGTLDTYP